MQPPEVGGESRVPQGIQLDSTRPAESVAPESQEIPRADSEANIDNESSDTPVLDQYTRNEEIQEVINTANFFLTYQKGPPMFYDFNISPIDPVKISKVISMRLKDDVNEYLCTFNKSYDYYFAEWVPFNLLVNFNNWSEQINRFNTEGQHPIFMSSTSESLEVLSKYNKDAYLFKYQYNQQTVFFWDGPSPATQQYIDLFLEPLPTSKFKPKSLLFQGNIDILLNSIAYPSLFVVYDSDFDKWTTKLTNRGFRFIKYYGDDYSRGILRQFQMCLGVMALTEKFSIMITTYDILQNDLQYLSPHLDLATVYADHGQNLTNPNGKKCKSIFSIRSKSYIFIAHNITKHQENLIKNFIPNTDITNTKVINYELLEMKEEQLRLYRIAKMNQFHLIRPHHPRGGRSLLRKILNDPNQIKGMTFKYEIIKYEYLLATLKIITNPINIVFSSEKSMSLCAKYLSANKILFQYELDDFGSHIILSLKPIGDSILLIGFDTDVPRGTRLIVRGTIEHEMIEEEEDQEFEHIEYETNDLNFINGVHGKKIFTPFFSGKKEDVKMRIRNPNFEEGFTKCLLMFLLNIVGKETIYNFPFSIKKLNEKELSIATSALPVLKHLRKLFPDVDLSIFKEMKNTFAKSAVKYLSRIEHSIVIGYWSQYVKRLNNNKLPPTEDTSKDKDILMEIFQTKDTNCQRAKDIYNQMLNEVLSLPFVSENDRFITNFWTQDEVAQLLNALEDYGTQIVGFSPPAFLERTHLLAKKTDQSQYFASQLVNSIKYSTQKCIIEQPEKNIASSYFRKSFEFSDKECERARCHFDLNSSIRSAIDLFLLEKKDKVLSKGWNYSRLSFLLNNLIEFGISRRNQIILTYSKHELAQSDIDYLRGLYPVYISTVSSQLPDFLVNDSMFYNFVKNLTKTNKSILNNEKSEKGYTLSKDLLNRVAELTRLHNEQKITERHQRSQRQKERKTQQPKARQEISPMPAFNLINRDAEIEKIVKKKQKMATQPPPPPPVTIAITVQAPTPVHTPHFVTASTTPASASSSIVSISELMNDPSAVQPPKKRNFEVKSRVKPTQNIARQMTQEFLKSLPRATFPNDEQTQLEPPEPVTPANQVLLPPKKKPILHHV